MGRAASLFLAGIIAGFAAAIAYLEGLEAEETLSATAFERFQADQAGPGSAGPMSVPDSFDANLAAHERASILADSRVLERLIEDQAAQVPSSRRDAELEALLARLSEMDPRRAVEITQRLELGDDWLADVFQVWAASDPDAALTALSSAHPPAARRAAALGLLDAFGVDDAGINRVAAALSPVAASNFRIDAIGKLAEHDLPAALSSTSILDIPQAQVIAYQRIAELMAATDPRRGLELAGSIEPAQRRQYAEHLFDEWAKLDPEAALAHLETADLAEMTITAAGFRALAADGPERLLSLADRFAPAQRAGIQQAAFEVLTARDPVAALNRAMLMPLTGDRERIVRSIAERYVLRDPEGALIWATTLEPRSSFALDAVLSSVASDNPMRVADIVIAEILDPIAANRADLPDLASLLSAPMEARSPEISIVANKLVAYDDPRIAAQLASVVLRWSESDPNRALDWVLQNTDHLTPSTALSFAQILGRQDPELARQSVQRLPPNLLGPWIEGTASGMAPTNLDGAVAWLERYREHPVDENVMRSILSAATRTEPEAVARLIDENPESRSQLTSGVARVWVARDPAATERWILDMPRGPARDEGLAVLLQSAASQGTFDPIVLDGFSSERARGRALIQAMMAFGVSDPELGRRLIDQHLIDPDFRAMAERTLETGINYQPNVITLQ